MNEYIRHLLLPGILFGAAGTIAIFSFVFKENKFYRLFEHIFIGIAAGYGLAVTWTDVLRAMWWNPMVADGAWWWAFVIPLGMMFYGIYTTKFAWQSRLIFGVFFGLTAGTVFQGFCGVYIPQIRSSFRPLIPHPSPSLTARVSSSVGSDPAVWGSVIEKAE